MSTKSSLSKLRATLSKHQPDDRKIDVAIIAAVMDELAEVAADGTADAIELAQHKRTGYTFPASRELVELFSGG